MQKKVGDQRIEIINDDRVYTSSELIGKLNAEGFSTPNARKILSRESQKKSLWRSETLKLPRDERLFSRLGLVGTPSFFAQIGEKLRSTQRHGIARSVAALGTHKLLHRMDLLRLLAVTSSTDAALSGSRQRLSFEEECRSLEELGAKIIQRGTALESVVAPQAVQTGEDLDSLAVIALSRIRVETLLAKILTERFRKQNLISWNCIDIADFDKPYVVFNGQVFTAYGFSYLGPLRRWKDGNRTPTSCPVVIDCYHDMCSLPQVESLLQRIQRAAYRGRKQQPILGVIAARDFETEAWSKARQESLMTVSFRQLFGDEALNVMIQIEQLLCGICQSDPKNSQDQYNKVATLIEDLKVNPIVADLRAIGLELISALILQSNGFTSLELGRVVPWGSTSRDVDVFGIRADNELRIVECKAYHHKKSLLDSDVKSFLRKPYQH